MTIENERESEAQRTGEASTSTLRSNLLAELQTTPGTVHSKDSSSTVPLGTVPFDSPRITIDNIAQKGDFEAIRALAPTALDKLANIARNGNLEAIRALAPTNLDKLANIAQKGNPEAIRALAPTNLDKLANIAQKGNPEAIRALAPTALDKLADIIRKGNQHPEGSPPYDPQQKAKELAEPVNPQTDSNPASRLQDILKDSGPADSASQLEAITKDLKDFKFEDFKFEPARGPATIENCLPFPLSRPEDKLSSPRRSGESDEQWLDRSVKEIAADIKDAYDNNRPLNRKELAYLKDAMHDAAVLGMESKLVDSLNKQLEKSRYSVEYSMTKKEHTLNIYREPGLFNPSDAKRHEGSVTIPKPEKDSGLDRLLPEPPKEPRLPFPGRPGGDWRDKKSGREYGVERNPRDLHDLPKDQLNKHER